MRQWNFIRFLVFAMAVGCFLSTAAAESGRPSDARECNARGGLPNVFARLEAGKDVRIAYLGGSITAQEGWRPKTLEWFRREYAESGIEEINAAIGGTGSDLGVYRLEHDVLRFKPDLLFVEFAVNDGGAAPEAIHRAMEGIVRKTFRANTATDICFVYTITESMLKTLQDGKLWRSAAAMEQIAEHYQIPSIHMGIEAARLEKAGRLMFTSAKPKTAEEQRELAGKILFSPDGVHPYADTGHQLYYEAVVRSLLEIRKSPKAASSHVIGRPFRADNWEDARMIPVSAVRMSQGWRKLDPEKDTVAKWFSRRVPELYKADEAGESISFRFRGTAAGVYDLLGPDCGQVTVEVDGRPPVVRPRFDAYCTYHRLGTLMIASDLPDGVHEVRLTIHPDQPDKANILAGRNEKIDDPGRFDDTAWYVGAILLLGTEQL